MDPEPLRYADGPTAEDGVWIAAPPERVWPLVADVEAMPSRSGELQSVEWLDGHRSPAVGARFTGRNTHPRRGDWETVSEITACDPPREFAWAVNGPANPTASWRFTLTAQDGGTALRQWVRIGPGPSGLTPLIAAAPEKEPAIVAYRLRELRHSIAATLSALKAAAEAP